ncbi:peptide chain release factor 1 [Xylocopilactobacillus apicola]|uniref:Peptide chain release factor 1 n=1 Tax=Xylocopilactobacillus apicola TaxID=2932184 RepID=A0AAU9DQT2_9LACO|nr:peptide chain release factor 1 [Xylocopilactobacillus apicola]BDR58264.1 peptide chain release factor 1 [Xylocopilactobacillus apicola]
MDNFIEKIQALADRYNELQGMMSDPEIISDTDRYMKLSKEESKLRPIIEKYNRYTQNSTLIEENQEIIASSEDQELADLAKEEMKDAVQENQNLEQEIKVDLLPEDPNDEKNIIMEIRGAAGGDEASLFAGDLLSMYEKFVATQPGWKMEIVSSSPTEVGGFKEVEAVITGDHVYSKLKYENGAHRVQRVPVTESQGRVHTSTATVIIMPEYSETDYKIDPKDIRVDVLRSSGAGGQHINKTSSAVRMLHLPTGIMVFMEEQRSQQQNRAKALQILTTRVHDYYESQNQEEYDSTRKNLVGTGDRSERIRTYNYPQNRVTDHRIGLTLNKLDRVMDGGLGEVIDALVAYDQAQKLQDVENG